MALDGNGQPIREGFQTGTSGVQSGPEQPRVVANGGGGGAGPVIDVQPIPIEQPQAAPSSPPRREISDQWPITVRLLYRPIRGNNQEELTSLTFREPTAGDINRAGNPCRVDHEGDVIIDEKKMSLIMANLSGVLSPLLDRMDPRDWNSCAYRLRGFFLPDLSSW